MNKIAFIFLIILGLTGIITKVLEMETFFNVYLLVFIPFLSIYYVLCRKKLNLDLNYLILGALLLLYISDIYELNIFENTGLKEKIQIAIQLIVQLLYLISIRKEGAVMIQETKIDVLKIFIPAVLIFFAFGFFVFEENNVVNYFLLIIYAIEIAILLILSMFRPVVNKSYYSGVIGISFLFISGLFYFLNSYHSGILFLYSFSFSLYIISQIFIIESFSTSQKI
ncbi:hypothetical protein EGI22_07060 [Lacihabitans sp. LS3-19]|uniref:hypothetical protein n=1 Tax=Lacihabitans sp. LS3-19 TaxID=2487335 RepID=UPI0020CE7355|nr:hypothetical protein [Lacihabitans sp. LS3-19]MCP9767667.1 hypothetical protein [Lacihabitans sp. LS3-19]